MKETVYIFEENGTWLGAFAHLPITCGGFETKEQLVESLKSTLQIYIDDLSNKLNQEEPFEFLTWEDKLKHEKFEYDYMKKRFEKD